MLRFIQTDIKQPHKTPHRLAKRIARMTKKPSISSALPEQAETRDAKLALRTAGFEQVRQAHKQELIEDYVELIADLIEETGQAKQVNIAECLGVAQPTVAKMLKRLQLLGYVSLRPYQGAQLTQDGQALAENSRKRHQLVEEFLLALGIDEEHARRDAEGIEHHVSPATLRAFQRFLNKE